MTQTDLNNKVLDGSQFFPRDSVFLNKNSDEYKLMLHQLKLLYCLLYQGLVDAFFMGELQNPPFDGYEREAPDNSGLDDVALEYGSNMTAESINKHDEERRQWKAAAAREKAFRVKADMTGIEYVAPTESDLYVPSFGDKIRNFKESWENIDNWRYRRFSTFFDIPLYLGYSKPVEILHYPIENSRGYAYAKAMESISFPLFPSFMDENGGFLPKKKTIHENPNTDFAFEAAKIPFFLDRFGAGNPNRVNTKKAPSNAACFNEVFWIETDDGFSFEPMTVPDMDRYYKEILPFLDKYWKHDSGIRNNILTPEEGIAMAQKMKMVFNNSIKFDVLSTDSRSGKIILAPVYNTERFVNTLAYAMKSMHLGQTIDFAKYDSKISLRKQKEEEERAPLRQKLNEFEKKLRDYDKVSHKVREIEGIKEDSTWMQKQIAAQKDKLYKDVDAKYPKIQLPIDFSENNLEWTSVYKTDWTYWLKLFEFATKKSGEECLLSKGDNCLNGFRQPIDGQELQRQLSQWAFYYVDNMPQVVHNGLPFKIECINETPQTKQFKITPIDSRHRLEPFVINNNTEGVLYTVARILETYSVDWTVNIQEVLEHSDNVLDWRSGFRPSFVFEEDQYSTEENKFKLTSKLCVPSKSDIFSNEYFCMVNSHKSSFMQKHDGADAHLSPALANAVYDRARYGNPYSVEYDDDKFVESLVKCNNAYIADGTMAEAEQEAYEARKQEEKKTQKQSEKKHFWSKNK